LVPGPVIGLLFGAVIHLTREEICFMDLFYGLALLFELIHFFDGTVIECKKPLAFITKGLF
jgi:hypothetical protein